MKKSQHKLTAIFACLAELIIGILLLIRPVGFTRGIIISLGVVSTVQGISAVYRYFTKKEPDSVESNLLVKGLTLTALGLFGMCRSGWFIAAFPVLTAFYGIVTLVSSFGKFQWALDHKRIKDNRWKICLISAILSLSLAVIILLNPFSSTFALWIFTGISLIVEAAVDFIAVFFKNKTA